MWRKKGSSGKMMKDTILNDGIHNFATTEIRATGLEFSGVKYEPEPLNIGHT